MEISSQLKGGVYEVSFGFHSKLPSATSFIRKTLYEIITLLNNL